MARQYVLPARAAGVQAQVVGDEVVVLNRATQQAHALSGLVADVWRASEAGVWTGATNEDFHAALGQLVEAQLLAQPSGVTRRAVLARTGLVAAGVGLVSVGLPTVDAAASGQAITRTPTSGPVGTVVSVSGTGFPANSLITITFDGVTMTTTPAAPTTNGSGSFTNVQFTVPAAPAGTHTIAAIAGGQSATTTFTVTPNLTSNAPPAATLRNGGGAPGQTITISGTGYAPNSAVTISRGGDFTAATIPAGITTDATGSFTATITGIRYPNGAGSGSFTATDAASNTATVTIPH